VLVAPSGRIHPRYGELIVTRTHPMSGG